MTGLETMYARHGTVVMVQIIVFQIPHWAAELACSKALEFICNEM